MWICAIPLILKPPMVPHSQQGQHQILGLQTQLLPISFPTTCPLPNSHEPQAPFQRLKKWSSDLYGWYMLLLLLHMVSSYISTSQPPQAEVITGFRSVCEASAATLNTQHFIYSALAPKPSLKPTWWSTSRSGTPHPTRFSIHPRFSMAHVICLPSQQISWPSRRSDSTAMLMYHGECVYYKAWKSFICSFH